MRNIRLSVDDKGKTKIASEGFDPDFGARPIRRLIQRKIQDKLALKILSGDFKSGDKVLVTAKSGSNDFVFSKN